MNFFRQTWILFKKDFRLEMYTKEVLYSSLLFALVLVVVFLFSGFSSPELMEHASSSVLWVSIAFVGTLIFTRTFQREQENNAISAILLIPDILGPLYFAKLAGNFMFMFIVQLMMIPLVFMTFRVDATQTIVPIFAIMSIGTLGFCALGTVLSASLATVKMREVILPIALFPLAIPLLIAGVKATDLLLHPNLLHPNAPFAWLKLMLAFDVIYLVLGRWLFAEAVDSGAM